MKRTGLIEIAGYFNSGTGRHQSNTVYRARGIIPALTTIDGGTQQIKVLKNMKDIEKIGYTNPSNEHQSGLVVGRGGVLPSQYSVQWKDPVKTIRRVSDLRSDRRQRESEQGF